MNKLLNIVLAVIVCTPYSIMAGEDPQESHEVVGSEGLTDINSNECWCSGGEQALRRDQITADDTQSFKENVERNLKGYIDYIKQMNLETVKHYYDMNSYEAFELDEYYGTARYQSIKGITSFIDRDSPFFKELKEFFDNNPDLTEESFEQFKEILKRLEADIPGNMKKACTCHEELAAQIKWNIEEVNLYIDDASRVEPVDIDSIDPSNMDEKAKLIYSKVGCIYEAIRYVDDCLKNGTDTKGQISHLIENLNKQKGDILKISDINKLKEKCKEILNMAEGAILVIRNISQRIMREIGEQIVSEPAPEEGTETATPEAQERSEISQEEQQPEVIPEEEAVQSENSPSEE